MLPNKFVAIDTEATGLSVYKGDRMFSAACCWDSGDTKFWYKDWSGLDRILADESVDKVFHNAKFDLKMLEKAGLKVRGKVWDTMIFGHLLDGNQLLALGEMSKRYLPADQRKVTDEIAEYLNAQGVPKGDHGKHFADLPINILEKRNTIDTVLTCGIFKRVFQTVSNVFPYLLEQEHKLLHVVKRMEDRGIEIDEDEVEKQKINFDSIVEAVIQFCEGVVGHEGFNLNAASDQKALLDKAGLYEQLEDFTDGALKLQQEGVVIPGKSDRRKLDDYNLRNLHHPLAHMLLVGKAAAKMRSTFLEGISSQSVNGVIHPSFNQLGTTTGRFSCSGPNLQNIPIEGDRRTSLTEDESAEAVEMTGINYAPHIKRIFKVRKGKAHIHSDKRQGEIFMMGHYVNDPTVTQMLLRTIDKDTSIHDEICQVLYGEWTKGLKTRTKAVVFGFQYGAGNATLARKIGGTIQEAIDIRARLAKQIPALPRWLRQLKEQINERGYVLTDHGRRHYIKDSESYMSINRMCQGTLGDEIKSRMIALDDFYRSEGEDASVILNIHDDIGSEIPAENPAKVRKYVPEISRIMHETGIKYRLPLPSSMDISYTRWSDLKEIKSLRDVPLRSSK